jgi:hypothetical protein
VNFAGSSDPPSGLAHHERLPRMASTTSKRTALLTILALLTAAATTGCSPLKLTPDMALDPQASAAGNQQAMVVVELHHGKNKIEHLRAPLKGNMLVQDALKGSGAVSRFHRMDIVLVRETPEGKKVRLPVKYDVNRRQVVDSNNYAMYAGDVLEVTENTSTVIDRMLESALQPLQPMIRRPGID